MNWSNTFATRTKNMKPSVIREILKLTQTSSVISFAGGLPAPQLFPVERIRQAAETVLSERGAEALQYGTSEGYRPLREWVAARLQTATASADTPAVTAEQVQIVSGSQQALDLVAKIFLDPGDTVLVGAPTYMGALRAFDAYQVNYLSIPTDDEGMLPEALAAALRTRPKLVPKLIYVIPTFDNPTGVTMTLARRQALVELARHHGVPILEDNPYGELRFEGAAVPHLYTLAPELVIYAGTFSKIMAPGLRLAWVVAAPEVITLLTRAKQAADLHTATYTQMVAHEVTKDDFMDAQVGRVRDHYRGQRDLMLKALERHMPRGVRWTRPAGGMFLWCTLPDGLDATELAYEAAQQGVVYIPGESFFTDDSGQNTLRLSYSVATPEQLDEGLRRLGGVFAQRLTFTTC